MSCPDCQQTEQCIDCPEAVSGVAGSRLYDIYYVKNDSDISGAGYTENIYTNNTTTNKTVFIETNCSIETDANPHEVTSDYLNDGVSVVTSGPMIQYLQYRSDYTHFLTSTIVAPGKTVSLKFTSADVTAKLKWLVAAVYTY